MRYFEDEEPSPIHLWIFGDHDLWIQLFLNAIAYCTSKRSRKSNKAEIQ